ncbi:hypothetical protein NHX12_029355, partial [Muraenolepis orangiensis]
VERMMHELDMRRDLSRVIVHVDMDAFYAAVEMRDCPELKDKPMAVGSMSMLSTSNYHARKFGVRAGMPGFIAKKLCPNLVIVPTNFDKYRAVSTEIREIFAEYDPHFQPMSLDEAYLDFTDHLEQRISWPESLRTHCLRTDTSGTGELQSKVPQESEPCAENLSPLLFEDSPSTSPCLPASGETAVPGGSSEVFGTCVEEAVREMRFRIEQKTTLTASAGIAPNTMLAKVCSDKNKPNGQYRLPSNARIYSACLGSYSCDAFINYASTDTPTKDGQVETERPRAAAQTQERHREREGNSTRNSGDSDRGKTVTLKLKNVKFEVKTRAWTLPCAVATSEEIFAAAKDLLKTEIENVSPQRLRLRLMGVRISTFVSADDKKPQQKSIMGFLQQGSSGPSQGFASNRGKETVSPPPSPEQQPHLVPRLQGLPWTAGQTALQVGVAGEEQPQSFFRRAYAKKLQLQVESSRSLDKRPASVCSGLTQRGTDSLTSSGSAIETHKSEGGLLVSGGHQSIASAASVRLAPPEASASTSGCSAANPDTLTCPVCFSEVRTTDLNMFNRHIDRCLGGVAAEPRKTTDTDSESGGEGGLEGSTAKAEPIEEQGDDGERRKKWKPDEDLDDFKICKTLRRPRRVTTVPGTLERRSVDEPLSDRHSFRSVCPSQRASPPRGGNPAALTSRLQSLPGHVGSTLVCPVCRVPQNTEDLALFNRHVDLCLNQEVLHELGEHSSSSGVQPPITDKRSKGYERDQHTARPSKGKSKRRGPPTSPPTKKAKTLGSQNTIDKFFR